MSPARLLTLAALVLASSALGGCTATVGYLILDRPAKQSDRIPSDFGVDQLANMDRDSARLAGKFEASSLYLLRSDNGDVCLAVYPAVSVACGGNGNFTMGLTGVGTFDVAPAPRDATDGFVLVGENILVNKQSVRGFRSIAQCISSTARRFSTATGQHRTDTYSKALASIPHRGT